MFSEEFHYSSSSLHRPRPETVRLHNGQASRRGITVTQASRMDSIYALQKLATTAYVHERKRK